MFCKWLRPCLNKEFSGWLPVLSFLIGIFLPLATSHSPALMAQTSAMASKNNSVLIRR